MDDSNADQPVAVSCRDAVGARFETPAEDIWMDSSSRLLKELETTALRFMTSPRRLSIRRETIKLVILENRG